MIRLRLAVVVVFSLSLLAVSARAQKLEKMYVFGDSYSDQGEGYLDADGPTAVVYMAQKLGIQLTPANTEDIKYRSLNYAISGAQSGSGKGNMIQGKLIGYGMKNQVDDFVDSVHAGSIDFNPKTALFFLAGGLNDSRMPDGMTVENEENLIRELYKAGARRFAVALLTEKIPGFGKQGVRLNASLSKIPEDLKGELPDAKIYASHWGLFYDEVQTNPAKYGLTNTTEACAGKSLGTDKPCDTPEKHFFYFGGHPSTAAHKAVGEMLYQEAMEKGGVPAQ